MESSSLGLSGGDVGLLGIEHVPGDIVRFILRGADHLSRFHFGKRLSDEGVRVRGVVTGDEAAPAGPSPSGIVDVVLGDAVCASGRSSVYSNDSSPIVVAVDQRIQETFARGSTPEAMRSLHVPSLRLLRRGIDQISTQGVVALVLDGGWLKGSSGRGVRLSLQDQLSDIYVFDLRSERPTTCGLKRGSSDGAGPADTPGSVNAALFIGVKREVPDDAVIHYRDVDNHLTWQQKLRVVSKAGLRDDHWQIVEPEEDGSWW